MIDNSTCSPLKPNLKKWLCFDFGLKTIGVAIGQTISSTASPLEPIRNHKGKINWDSIERVIHEWRPNALLVGLPINMDSTESELSKQAINFAKKLSNQFNLPVEMMDERLSSFEAKGIAVKQGHRGNYHEKPIDSLAAQLILESWLQR